MKGVHLPDRARPWHALLCAAIGCGSQSPTDLDPVPDEVPIAVTGERFVVPVRVGDAPPFNALLDTGSAGLRMLPGAVPASAYTATETQVAYGYGSDLYIYGFVALAPVTLGTRSTPIPIRIMVITDSACPPGTGCNPTQVLNAHFSGLSAILGVGMRTFTSDRGIGSPIAQLAGHPPFVVHVPGAQSDSGVLRIGALPSDPFAFTTYQLPPLAGGSPLPDGTRAWNDISVPTCVGVESSSSTYCLPSLWDTGAPFAYVSTPAQPAPFSTQLPLGSSVSITFGAGSSTPVSYAFLVGPAPRSGIDLITLEPAVGQAYVSPGLGLFFRNDALFDPERGIVGLAANGVSSGAPQ
jgi:hypothetical protein